MTALEALDAVQHDMQRLADVCRSKIDGEDEVSDAIHDLQARTFDQCIENIRYHKRHVTE
jgi:ferritin